jgi:hypothetical protein
VVHKVGGVLQSISQLLNIGRSNTPCRCSKAAVRSSDSTGVVPHVVFSPVSRQRSSGLEGGGGERLRDAADLDQKGANASVT